MSSATCRLAIPFHIAQSSNREIGVDAFFWDALEAPWRWSLLVFPASLLSPTPSGFEAYIKVGFEEQIRDVKAFLEDRGRLGVKEGRAWRLFVMRIAGLLLPGHYIYDRIARDLSSIEARAPRIARDIARLVVESIPLGRVAWANIRVVEKLGKVFVAHNGSLVEKNYSYLASVDAGFRRRLREILEACRREPRE